MTTVELATEAQGEATAATGAQGTAEPETGEQGGEGVRDEVLGAVGVRVTEAQGAEKARGNDEPAETTERRRDV